jgi:hypothetical protein
MQQVEHETKMRQMTEMHQVKMEILDIQKQAACARLQMVQAGYDDYNTQEENVYYTQL